MNREDHEDGRKGYAPNPDADMNAYRAGQREAAAGTYDPAWSTSEADGKHGPVSIGIPEARTVDNPAFLIYLLIPLLTIPYPVMGWTAIAVLAGLYWLIVLLHINPALGIVLALIPAVGSVYWGWKLEHRAAHSRIYRKIRGVLRVAGTFAFGAGMGSGKKPSGPPTLEMFQNFGFKAVVIGVVFVFVGLWVFRKLDAHYFPLRQTD